MSSRGEDGAADTVPTDLGTPSDLEVPPDLDARPAVCARSRRAAFAAFVALEIAALPVLLHLGRNRWFQYDEWDFLASRDAGSLGDLFEPHNVHWSTLPILAYRGLWQLFGINTYFPYLLLVVVSHLGVVALVRGVMRRSGVRPWTATGIALVLLFFGAGYENIHWAFQITWNASLAAGMAHLVLADHDGPWARRDALGLTAGLVGLLCSGVAVAMVLVVGVAVLLRRGPLVAVAHTAPLGIIYLVWWGVIGSEGFDGQRAGGIADIAGFVGDAAEAVLLGFARTPLLAWALAATAVAGLALAWHRTSATDRWSRFAAPAAMLMGALAFIVITGIGRSEREVVIVANNRYLYVSAALVVPALALAIDEIIRRLPATAPIFGALLVVSVVGNLRDFGASPSVEEFRRAQKNALLLLPRLPIAGELPGEIRPDALAPSVTLGWLRDGVRTGRVPEPEPMDATAKATHEGMLVLQPVSAGAATACEPRPIPTDLVLDAGGLVLTTAESELIYSTSGGVESNPIRMPRSTARAALTGPVEIRVVPVAGKGTVEVCRRASAPPPGG